MATKGSGNWKNNLDGEKKKDLKMWQNENGTADLRPENSGCKGLHGLERIHAVTPRYKIESAE